MQIRFTGKTIEIDVHSQQYMCHNKSTDIDAVKCWI